MNSKIENTEQTCIVSPHLNKFESRFARERCKLFRCVFVGKLSDDFFATPEMKLLFVKLNELVDFADQMHFDAAGG